jgi:16S rRNA (cytosine1402-N4)-methyltransferase
MSSSPNADLNNPEAETLWNKKKGDSENSFGTLYHTPVMLRECIGALLECTRSRINRKDQNDTHTTDQAIGCEPLIFVDGTLGGGGHTAALLEQLQPGDIVFGCDVDPKALETASQRLKAYMIQDESEQEDFSTDHPIFIPVKSNFCDLATVLPTILHPGTQRPILQADPGGVHGGVDGILLDLGVSSHQIDTPQRGFAFMKDGPLDMRMGVSNNSDKTGLTAADICNVFDLDELQRILSVYGDEPRAKTIAKAIVDSRPIETTGQLVEAVSSVTPRFAKKSKRMGRMATLARVFQSLRIVVNNEDGVLSKALNDMCPALLQPGGRLVVLSYHSMEDRATKRIIRDGTLKKKQRSHDERDIYGNYAGPPKPFKPVGKKQKATQDEVDSNPRARSATLRVAERL